MKNGSQTLHHRFGTFSQIKYISLKLHIFHVKQAKTILTKRKQSMASIPKQMEGDNKRTLQCLSNGHIFV